MAQTQAAKEVMYLCAFVGEIYNFIKLVMLNCDN